MKTNILFVDLHCDATMPTGAKEFGGGNSYSRGVLNCILKHEELNCLYITRKKFKELPDEEILGDNCKLYRITLGADDSDDKDTLQNYLEDAVKQIFRLIKINCFEKFIIHSSYWQSGLVALNILEKFPTQFIHTIQSNGMKKLIVASHQVGLNFRIESEKQIFNQADRLICSSIAEQQEIQKLYGITTSKLVITGLPIDENFCHPTMTLSGQIKTYSIGKSVNNFYLPLQVREENRSWWWVNGPFLYYGRLHVDKGICEIIEAWENLCVCYKGRTPPLWIVGGTLMQIEKIRAVLASKGILIDEYEKNHQIIWWGTLSPADLSCLLTKSIAVVTHSRYESGGLMVLESLAANVPVIATPFGYAQSYIHDWYNGFLVEFGNISLLQYRMSHFINQPYLSDLMKKKAKTSFEIIKQKFDFEKLHCTLYLSEKIEQSPSDLLLGIDNTNLILPYSPIPNDETVVTNIKQILQFHKVEIIQRLTTNNSYALILKVNDRFYRADYWLTSINELVPCFCNEYTISASQLTNNISNLSRLCGFHNLTGSSLSNKLTLIQYYNKQQTFSEAIRIYNNLFYSEQKNNFITVSWKTVIDKLKNFIATMLETNSDILLNFINQLETYSKKNSEEYGIVPLFASKDIIYDGCFYGVTDCTISTYGMGIALLLRLFDNNIDLSKFSTEQIDDIENWSIFFKIFDLSILIYKQPQIDITKYADEISDFFKSK